jgi:hypothetical protein
MIGDWIISLPSTSAVAAGQFSSNAARRWAVWTASACMLSTICCCEAQPATANTVTTAANEVERRDMCGLLAIRLEGGAGGGPGGRQDTAAEGRGAGHPG